MRSFPLRVLIVGGGLFGLAGNAPVHSGPAIVPYQCGDGRIANVVYDSGNDYVHASARVTLDGRTIDMKAAPTLYGVRYRSEAAPGATALAWSLRGEEGVLSEAPTDMSYVSAEHELARCTRVRVGAAEDGATAAHR